jgi:hypothetical protein
MRICQGLLLSPVYCLSTNEPTMIANADNANGSAIHTAAIPSVMYSTLAIAPSHTELQSGHEINLLSSESVTTKPFSYRTPQRRLTFSKIANGPRSEDSSLANLHAANPSINKKSGSSDPLKRVLFTHQAPCRADDAFGFHRTDSFVVLKSLDSQTDKLLNGGVTICLQRVG